MEDRDLSNGSEGLSTVDEGRNAWPEVSRAAPLLVLIVDDEVQIAQTLAFIVEDAGYASVVATHGSEALQVARERRPALVLTDLMMPHLNGDRLIATLRADAESSGLPPPTTVLMTAAGHRHVQDAGADAVLLKPFELQEVEALLRRFLGPPPGDR